MPFAFLIVGLVLTVSGVKGTSQDLVSLLKSDLSGSKNFLYWALSILVIGGLGYITAFRPLSRAFLALVLIVLILSNGGFFQLFNQGIATISSNNSSLGATNG